MLVLFAAVAADASTFSHVQDLAELAERSSAVIAGEVTEASASEGPYGVVTRYTISVQQTLAGAAPEEVSIALPGGRLGGLTQRFSGVPLWAAGDEVVVFLTPPGRPQALSGLFSRTGDALVDPLERSASPLSLGGLTRALYSLPVGEADDAYNPQWAVQDSGTPEP